jgi:hypothetical protein
MIGLLMISELHEQARKAKEQLREICTYQRPPSRVNKVMVRSALCILGIGFLLLGIQSQFSLPGILVGGSFLACLILA